MSASCELHGKKKPSRCKNYPTSYDYVVKGCGYKFGDEGVREGACKRCGQCCAIPRVGGEPGAGYDPHGEPCKHLKAAEHEKSS